jgi:hypothetical protein
MKQSEIVEGLGKTRWHQAAPVQGAPPAQPSFGEINGFCRKRDCNLYAWQD